MQSKLLLLLLPLAHAQNLLLIGGVDESLNPYTSSLLVTPNGTCNGVVADLPVGLAAAQAVWYEAGLQILLCGGSLGFGAEDKRYE